MGGFVPNPAFPRGRKPVELITDRAARYRAQKNVSGPKRCVICGKNPRGLMVMHLDGDESNGEPRNLAWGCRSCNTSLGLAFKRMGSKNRTRQYNPEGKHKPPTFQQWAWGVSHHVRGAHDEGGRIIHATPRHLRIEYNRRIWDLRRERGEFEVPF